MSKHKKRNSQTSGNSRDAPVQSAVAIAPVDLWWRSLEEGYVPLYDCPEVKMCVHQYADLISNMTIHLMENTPEGDVRIRNALSRKLDIEPSRYMTRKGFVYNIVNTMMTTGDGNCVVYPVFDREGLLEDLIPLPPSMVSFRDLPEGGYRIVYGEAELSPEEVLHFRLNPDPERPWIGRGWSVSIREVVKSIRLSGQTRKTLLKSPSPSVIVKVDGLDRKMASPSGRKELAQQYVGNEPGEPWIIPAELMEVTTVKPMTMSDLAIRDNLELDKRTVAGIFTMPPFVVGVGNYNEPEWRKFVNTSIMGVAQTIQQTLTQGLIYKESWYWKFNPRSLYNYTLSELITAGSAMVDRMAMTRNEWRDWAGLSPRENMAELLALENYIPAAKLGDQKKLKGGGDNGNQND